MFETYTCRNTYQLYKCRRNIEYFALLARTLSHVQLQFAGHLKRLLTTAIDSERFEVLKN